MATLLAAGSAAGQVVFAPFTCEYYESMCKTDAEREAAKAKRLAKEAASLQRKIENQLKREEEEEEIRALERQLGAHRKAEIERLIALKNASEKARAASFAAGNERRRKSCIATYEQTKSIPCTCVGLVPVSQKGTACGM